MVLKVNFELNKIMGIHLVKMVISCMAAVLFSCGSSKDEVIILDDEGGASNSKEFTLTEKEKAYVENLRKKGGLVIACRLKEGTYQIDENDFKHGFMYDLAKSFADKVNIKLNVKVCLLNDFFSKDGIIPASLKTGHGHEYTPDLMKEVDIAVDSLTILPWRKKLVDFVTILPVSVILVSRPEFNSIKLDSLDTLRVAVKRNSSYEAHLTELCKKNKLKCTFIYTESTQGMVQAVVDNMADITLQDSNQVYLFMKKYPGKLKVHYPVTEVLNIGWFVKKNDIVLNELLQKYLEYSKESGIFQRLFAKEFNISFDEYINLVQSQGGRN